METSKSTSQTNTPEYTKKENVARLALGAMLITAGIGHLTFARKEFQAQVPNWVPVDKDTTVLLSGVAEIALGATIAGLKKERVKVGIGAALFFAAVFPGNIAQYKNRRDAFGLDTDEKRFARLFMQPVLMGWALYGGGALEALKNRKKK
jgi:uncharacterized membrane protein